MTNSSTTARSAAGDSFRWGIRIASLYCLPRNQSPHRRRFDRSSWLAYHRRCDRSVKSHNESVGDSSEVLVSRNRPGFPPTGHAFGPEIGVRRTSTGSYLASFSLTAPVSSPSVYCSYPNFIVHDWFQATLGAQTRLTDWARRRQCGDEEAHKHARSNSAIG